MMQKHFQIYISDTKRLIILAKDNKRDFKYGFSILLQAIALQSF